MLNLKFQFHNLSPTNNLTLYDENRESRKNRSSNSLTMQAIKLE